MGRQQKGSKSQKVLKETETSRVQEGPNFAIDAEVLAVLLQCTGQKIYVTVRGDKKIEGYYHSIGQVKEGGYGLVLRYAIEYDDKTRANNKSTQVKISDTIIISEKEFISFDTSIIQEVEMQQPPTDLAIDSLILDRANLKTGEWGRELKPWKADNDGQQVDDVNQDTFGDDLETGEGWDQFETNQEKFGVKTTFDENLYTTKIDETKFSTTQIQEAEKLAQEIKDKNQRHPRLDDQDNMEDEETMFSAVKRDAPPTGNMADILNAMQPSKHHKAQPSNNDVNILGKDDTFDGKVSGQPQEIEMDAMKHGKVQSSLTQQVEHKNKQVAQPIISQNSQQFPSLGQSQPQALQAPRQNGNNHLGSSIPTEILNSLSARLGVDSSRLPNDQVQQFNEWREEQQLHKEQEAQTIQKRSKQLQEFHAASNSFKQNSFLSQSQANRASGVSHPNKNATSSQQKLPADSEEVPQIIGGNELEKQQGFDVYSPSKPEDKETQKPNSQKAAGGLSSSINKILSEPKPFTDTTSQTTSHTIPAPPQTPTPNTTPPNKLSSSVHAKECNVAHKSEFQKQEEVAKTAQKLIQDSHQPPPSKRLDQYIYAKEFVPSGGVSNHTAQAAQFISSRSYSPRKKGSPKYKHHNTFYNNNGYVNNNAPSSSNYSLNNNLSPQVDQLTNHQPNINNNNNSNYYAVNSNTVYNGRPHGGSQGVRSSQTKAYQSGASDNFRKNRANETPPQTDNKGNAKSSDMDNNASITDQNITNKTQSSNDVAALMNSGSSEGTTYLKGLEQTEAPNDSKKINKPIHTNSGVSARGDNNSSSTLNNINNIVDSNKNYVNSSSNNNKEVALPNVDRAGHENMQDGPNTVAASDSNAAVGAGNNPPDNNNSSNYNKNNSSTNNVNNFTNNNSLDNSQVDKNTNTNTILPSNSIQAPENTIANVLQNKDHTNGDVLDGSKRDATHDTIISNCQADYYNGGDNKHFMNNNNKSSKVYQGDTISTKSIEDTNARVTQFVGNDPSSPPNASIPNPSLNNKPNINNNGPSIISNGPINTHNNAHMENRPRSGPNLGNGSRGPGGVGYSGSNTSPNAPPNPQPANNGPTPSQPGKGGHAGGAGQGTTNTSNRRNHNNRNRNNYPQQSHAPPTQNINPSISQMPPYVYQYYNPNIPQSLGPQSQYNQAPSGHVHSQFSRQRSQMQPHPNQFTPQQVGFNLQQQYFPNHMSNAVSNPTFNQHMYNTQGMQIQSDLYQQQQHPPNAQFQPGLQSSPLNPPQGSQIMVNAQIPPQTNPIPHMQIPQQQQLLPQQQQQMIQQQQLMQQQQVSQQMSPTRSHISNTNPNYSSPMHSNRSRPRNPPTQEQTMTGQQPLQYYPMFYGQYPQQIPMMQTNMAPYYYYPVGDRTQQQGYMNQ